MNNVIDIHGLSFAYGGKKVLNDITLHLAPGNFYALLGSNGAGKTTLLKILAGMLEPKAGTATVLGREASKLLPEDWTSIGYVSENQPVYDWLTGDELIAFTRPLYPNWDQAFCDMLAQRMRLPLQRKVRGYSKGERMKMVLLLAMAFHPKLLLLDEPFSGLDVLAKEQLISCLLEATHQEQWSVMLASHDLMEVERLADVIGFIDNGSMKISEPLEELQARFRRVQAFGTGMNGYSDPSALHLRESQNGVTFIETQFSGEREAALRQRFDSTVEISPLSLREIILALSTNELLPV